MKDHVIQKWSCSTCSKAYVAKSDAERCCPSAKEVWVCQICNEQFWDEPESKEHVHTIEEMTPLETYLDKLRFDPVPPLGQWQSTMEAEMEFLIP